MYVVVILISLTTTNTTESTIIVDLYNLRQDEHRSDYGSAASMPYLDETIKVPTNKGKA